MGLYNDLSPAPSYSGRAETMGGNGTETNIYSTAPSLVTESHCSLVNTTNAATLLHNSLWYRNVYGLYFSGNIYF